MSAFVILDKWICTFSPTDSLAGPPREYRGATKKNSCREAQEHFNEPVHPEPEKAISWITECPRRRGGVERYEHKNGPTEARDGDHHANHA